MALLRGTLPAALLVGAWLWLHAPALRWLGAVAFAHASYGANLALLCALFGGLAYRLRRGVPLQRAPTAEPLALGLCLGGAVAFALAERLLQIHIFSALLMGLGGYGLLGLFLPPGLFRRALPGALLCCALLPFGAHGSTLIGLGARVLSARIVESLLAGLGVAATSAESILILENGMAHVDAPCSGLRSLWAGLCFFFAASWLDRRRPGLRWLLVLGACAALLLSANVLRVLALVLCTVVLRCPALADVLHLPLGVFGFLLACAGALLLLRGFVPRIQILPEASARPPLGAPGHALLTGALAGLALAGSLMPRPAPEPAPAPLTLPGIDAGPAPLTTAELALLSRFGAHADKRYIAHGPLRGSLLAITTTALRAQHPPELCLSAAGLRIERMEVGRSSTVPFRRLKLRAPGGRHLVSVYWFQSRERTTWDFWSRLGSAFRGERRWVMVSLLLDDRGLEDDGALAALIAAVHGAVQRSLEGGSS